MKNMTDIVERLHELAGDLAPGVDQVPIDAADEIERLRERVAALQAELGYTESIKALMTENDLYYLQSILRQLREVRSLTIAVGDKMLADNIDWLASLISRGEKALHEHNDDA